MNNSHLISCRETFEKTVKEVMDICRHYDRKKPGLRQLADDFEKTVQERLADFNPKIMVYGIYNSGKSTLLNALMGENRAKMNDIPTTHSIDEYQWNEYTIYDTPGIDAPEKDEEVSKQQLEKSDVIIFVMDTEGSFEIGKNYQELVDIVHSGKHLLIVLNNKSDKNIQDEVQFFNEKKQKIYKNFAEKIEQSPEEIAKKVGIYVVNAQYALMGRTDKTLSETDRNIIISSSNIQALEDAIIREYKNTSVFSIIKQLQIRLEEKLKKLNDLLIEIIGDATARKGVESIAKIQELQDNLVNKIKDYAQSSSTEIRNQIYSVISSSEHPNEEDIKTKLENINTGYHGKVYKFAKEELERVSDRVDGIIGEFKSFANANLESFKVSSNPIDDSSLSQTKYPNVSSSNDSSLGLGDKLKMATAIGGGAIPALAPVIAPIVAIPVVGQIIAGLVAVGSALSLIFGGKSSRDKEEKERYNQLKRESERQKAIENEKARIKQELRDYSDKAQKTMFNNILDQIRKGINEALQPYIMKIKETIKNADFEIENATKARERIRELIQNMNDMLHDY